MNTEYRQYDPESPPRAGEWVVLPKLAKRDIAQFQTGTDSTDLKQHPAKRLLAYMLVAVVAASIGFCLACYHPGKRSKEKTRVMKPIVNKQSHPESTSIDLVVSEPHSEKPNKQSTIQKPAKPTQVTHKHTKKAKRYTTPKQKPQVKHKNDVKATKAPDVKKGSAEATKAPDVKKGSAEATKAPDVKKGSAEATKAPDIKKGSAEGTKAPDVKNDGAEGTKAPTKQETDTKQNTPVVEPKG